MEPPDEPEDEVIDAEIVDAEIVDAQPRRCPSCESLVADRGKNFAAYAVFMVSPLGAAIAIEQRGVAFLALVVLLVVYYVMPPYSCHDCGKRFDLLLLTDH